MPWVPPEAVFASSAAVLSPLRTFRGRDGGRSSVIRISQHGGSTSFTESGVLRNLYKIVIEHKDLKALPGPHLVLNSPCSIVFSLFASCSHTAATFWQPTGRKAEQSDSPRTATGRREPGFGTSASALVANPLILSCL